MSLLGSHVFITGGSSGIGKALAYDVIINRGCRNVSLLARDLKNLQEVQHELMNIISEDSLKISLISLDINSSDIKKHVEESIISHGPIDILINCAGSSFAKIMEDTSMEEYKRLMNVNFFGSVSITKAVLPSMKRQRRGVIVFVSSQAGLLGLYGYSAYAASKFALRGLAESLSMEVQPYNISVSLHCPPDTNTPGFVEENKDKPEETRILSESGGLFHSDDVAKSIMDNALHGRFLSSIGLEGWCLTLICAGMSPISFIRLIPQVILAGIFRLVSWLSLMDMNRKVILCSKYKKDKKME